MCRWLTRLTVLILASAVLRAANLPPQGLPQIEFVTTALLTPSEPADRFANATPALLQAQQPTRIFVGRRATDARSVSAGTAELVADAAEVKVTQALQNRLPCYETSNQTSVATVLGWERFRQILGGGDPDALRQMGDAVGARYTVIIDVDSFGDGRTNVTISAFDQVTMRKLATQVTSFKTEDFDPADLEPIADKLVDGMSSSLRPCPETMDVVTITNQSGGSGNNADGGIASASMTLNMSCKIDRQRESETTCQVTYSSEMSSSDGTRATEKAQGKVTCDIGVDVGERTTRLHVGMFRMATEQTAVLVIKDADGKVHTTSLPSSTGQIELGGWEFEGPPRPAANGGTSGSGSFGTIKANWTVKGPFGR